VVNLIGGYHLTLKVIFPPPLQAGTGGEFEGYNTVRPVPSFPRVKFPPTCNLIATMICGTGDPTPVSRHKPVASFTTRRGFNHVIVLCQEQPADATRPSGQ
jgi:hypothetical protein